MEERTSRAQVFQVTLALTAPGDPPPVAVERVVQLLSGAGHGRWLEVSAEATDGGLDVLVVVSARSPEEAGAAVVDGVRALLGLDAEFTLWVLDGRHPDVEEVPL
jgi:hypothetical protein